MAEDYKIKAVKPDPKPWNSQYGPMITYTVLFEGREIPTEINKKPESPAPQVGDEVYGNINRTEYGDKFKSEQKGFAAGGSPSRGGGFAPKPQTDPFTMFLSYTKDIAVALVAAKAYTKDKLDEIVNDVATAGEMLYAMRPDATPKQSSTTGVQPEVASTDTVSDADLLKNIDDVFGIDQTPKEEEPWQEPKK